jgi:hypothetical protein
MTGTDAEERAVAQRDLDHTMIGDRCAARPKDGDHDDAGLIHAVD